MKSLLAMLEEITRVIHTSALTGRTTCGSGSLNSLGTISGVFEETQLMCSHEKFIKLPPKTNVLVNKLLLLCWALGAMNIFDLLMDILMG